MPCTKKLDIDTSMPVMVTGATGYIAGVVIEELLKLGLTVHATVRDPTKKDRLQYLQDIADKSNGEIKFFAGDLLKLGSFDEAAAGCKVIFHMASPFVVSVEDPEKDLIEPAVHGTENVLNAANKSATVTNVVLTASCAGIYNHFRDLEDTPAKVYTEEVWNRGSTLTDNPYSLSKTLAEQKAWVMAGSQTQWKLCTINPGMVMGPGVKYHASAESFGMLLNIGGGAMASGAPRLPMGVVDVRDVAAAHIAAAYLPEAKGRHILVSANTDFVQMGQAIAEKYPSSEYPVATKELFLPKFVLWFFAYLGMLKPLNAKFISDNIGYKANFDNTKTRTELGINFYPLTKTMQDMYQQVLDEGVVVPKSKK